MEPTGIEPTGIEPTGIEPTGIEPTGIEPTGIEPTGIEPTGIEPTGVDDGAPANEGSWFDGTAPSATFWMPTGTVAWSLVSVSASDSLALLLARQEAQVVELLGSDAPP